MGTFCDHFNCNAVMQVGAVHSRNLSQQVLHKGHDLQPTETVARFSKGVLALQEPMNLVVMTILTADQMNF